MSYHDIYQSIVTLITDIQTIKYKLQYYDIRNSYSDVKLQNLNIVIDQYRNNYVAIEVQLFKIVCYVYSMAIVISET